MSKLYSSNHNSTHERGVRAELIAESYLAELGYRLVERNFRWRGGELDLVLLDPQNVLVFGEVRSSTAVSRTSGIWLRHSIGPAKRRRLAESVRRYQARRPWSRGRALRFDLLWVEGGRVEHWKNVIIW